MNNNSITGRHAPSDSRKGLLIAIAASLVLSVLVAYRVPLFHEEFHGTIIGVSEVHNESGSKVIAAVRLETGSQVLATMHRDLLAGKTVDVNVIEGRTLFGRKSYRIIAANE